MMGTHEQLGEIFGKVAKSYREHITSEKADEIGPTFKSNKDKLDKILGGGCR